MKNFNSIANQIMKQAGKEWTPHKVAPNFNTIASSIMAEAGHEWKPATISKSKTRRKTRTTTAARKASKTKKAQNFNDIASSIMAAAGHEWNGSKVSKPRSKRKRQQAKAAAIAAKSNTSLAAALAAVQNKKKKIVTAARPTSPWKNKDYASDQGVKAKGLENVVIDVPTINTKGLEDALKGLDNDTQRIMVKQRIFIENMLIKNKDFTANIDDKVLDEIATALYSIGPEQMDEIYRFLKDEDIEEKYRLLDPDYYGYDPEFTEMTGLLISVMDKLGLKIQ